MIHGVDVSSYQPGWRPGPDDSFVFIKATEGRSYRSVQAPIQGAQARAAGLVVGWYHYLWPSAQSGTPEVQAAYFLDWAPTQPGDLLACDWEPTAGGTAPEAEKDRFLAEVKRLRPDLKCGLYVNRWMWNSSSKRAGDFLWLAEYAPQPSITGWKFWQYADHGPNGESLDQDVAAFDTKQALQDWITPPKDGDMATWKDWSETEKRDLADRVAAKVLAKDGVIENTFTGQPDNPFVALATAVAFIARKVKNL